MNRHYLLSLYLNHRYPTNDIWWHKAMFSKIQFTEVEAKEYNLDLRVSNFGRCRVKQLK